MNNETINLIQNLIDNFDLEQKRLEHNITNGIIKKSASNEEVLTLAKELISDRKRIKRIVQMLEDVKSIALSNNGYSAQ
jgi:hypothetical protein